MTSTLTLINGTKITPERNFKLPSMNWVANSGLNGYQTISNFQYIKHSLNITIKVDIDQHNLEYIFANDVNYIIIKNNFTDTQGNLPKEVGYFVINKKWLAQKTIEYTLLCDVINSFNDTVEISNKTRILRQHKDRWQRRITGQQAHIGNITTHQKSYFDYSDFNELKILWFQNAGLTSEICFLYDLTRQSIDLGDEWKTIRFGYYGMSSINPAKYYWIDEDYNVIGQINHTPSDADWIEITYGGIAGMPVDVISDGNHISIPAQAKYIAVYGQTLTSEYSGVYVQIDDWDDLPEEEYEQALIDFEDYYELIEKTGVYIPAVIGSDKIIPIIDRYSENISPMLYGGTKYFLKEKGQLSDVNWYLVYKNQNNPDDSLVNPVDCYLYGSRQLTVAPADTSTASFDEDDIWDILCDINWYENKQDFNYDVANIILHLGEKLGIEICGTDNPTCSLHFTGGNIDWTGSLSGKVLIIQPMFAGSPDRMILWIALYDENGGFGASYFSKAFEITDTFSFTFTNGKIARQCNDENFSDQPSEIITWPQVNMFVGVGQSAYVKSIDDVNRTDAKLIKIIKLPYCPANITLDENGYIRYSDQWVYDSNDQSLKLNNFKTKFARMLDIEQPLTPWTNAFRELDYEQEVNPNADRDERFETKLYHSDFYLPKVIYDSFSFTFQLELMTTHPENKWGIQYNVSNNITSRFMFTFMNYYCGDNETRDYNNILYIARNNECVIFNQQYVNYIRTGYQYDKKSMELFIQQQNLGYTLDTIQSSITTGQSAFRSYQKSDYLSMLGGYANFGFNIAQAAISKRYAEISKQMELDAKKTQLQNQATGVIDANDVDLLDVYSQNKLALKIYEVSPRMKKALFNLFFYCGYICEEQGIPDTTSRLRFNFVQAEIVFVKTPNLPQEMIEELKNKYLAGITFLHAYDGQIDYDQAYENWETSILDR